MSAEQDAQDSGQRQPDLSTGGSRHTNGNKSVNAAKAELDPPPQNEQSTEVVPDAKISNCVKEFVEKYPERARTELATGDRQAIRREYANVETVEWEEDLRLSDEERERHMLDRPTGERDGEVSPFTWRDGLHTLLEKYETTKRTTIEAQKRDYDNLDRHFIDAKSRWMPSYQKKYKAQLDGWLRELTGGERPSGGETTAAFDNPHIALLTFSMSSIPNGDRVGPVDVFNKAKTTWSDHTYHAVRNTLRSLGFESDEWQYDRRAEPHTNERGDKAGRNACYGHEHVILVVDGDVSESDLRPIVDKHVEKCEWAGERAHGESAIEVCTPDEREDIAAYVADYCSIAPVDLLERSVEYQAWAAAATAANYRTVTRSEAARVAAEVDRCKQQYESDESAQRHAHGERVYRIGNEVCCAECGHAHDVNQDQTMAEHRLASEGAHSGTESDVSEVVPDGGATIEVITKSERSDQYGCLWEDANSAAQVGVGEPVVSEEQRERADVYRRIQIVKDTHPERSAVELAAKYDALEHIDVVRLALDESVEIDVPDFDNTPSFGCDKKPEWQVPEWQVQSVWIGEERENASGGNGMDYVETTDYRERYSDVIDDEHWYRCDCGVKLWGTDMAEHMGTAHGIESIGKVRRLTEIESHDSK